MRAAQINEQGEKDVLKVVEAPKPTAGSGEVLVEVHAASVNPFDWKVRSGMIQMPLTYPATLGGDFAGVVAEVGDSVQGFAAGQEVFGQASTGKGSFAEYTTVSVDHIALKPKNVDFKTASALPLTAVSAYQALVDTLNLSSGQKILIHGGAGGIGSMAIPLAKHLGAHVATTVSTQDIDYVKQLGADEVIDYTSQKFEDQLHEFDAVYDLVGGDTYTRSFDILKPGGKIVSMLESANEQLAEEHQVEAISQVTKTTSERLAKVAELADQGVLRVTIDKVFPLDQAADALEYIHTDHHRGKVIIEVKNP